MSKEGHLVFRSRPQRQEVGRSSDEQSPDVLISVIVTDKINVINMASLTVHSPRKEEYCQRLQHTIY